jgi:hypothetical protein
MDRRHSFSGHLARSMRVQRIHGNTYPIRLTWSFWEKSQLGGKVSLELHFHFFNFNFFIFDSFAKLHWKQILTTTFANENK